MGRITHERDLMALVIAFGMEEVFSLLLGDIGWQGFFQTFLEMTVLAKDNAGLPAVHEFSATMAVNADHAPLLVDIRG